MTQEDIIHLADDCSHKVWELCMANPFFNIDECPVGANGVSDIVLNAILSAFPKTKELASVSEYPKEIEKTARISPGMLSNFGTSSFVLDVCLTQQELAELNLAPGLGSGSIKIKILCE